MTLNDQLLKAHATGDKPALVDLYTQAAEQSASEDARYFYLTQAYIFALDCGAAQSKHLSDHLRSAQRL